MTFSLCCGHGPETSVSARNLLEVKILNIAITKTIERFHRKLKIGLSNDLAVPTYLLSHEHCNILCRNQDMETTLGAIEEM